MGRFDFTLGDDFIKSLERLQDFESFAPKVLNATSKVLYKNIVNALSNHVETKSLVNSVKQTKAQQNEYGWYIVVRPTGKDEKGVRNMEKLAWLEFGTKNRDGVPVLSKALRQSQAPVEQMIQQMFKDHVEGR